MKIVFMGTPDFAVPSLDAVLDAGHTVAAVFTRPDRPRGRGLQISASPVKTRACVRGLAVYQPESFKNGAQDAFIQRLEPDCIVVTAYGRILPKSLLDIPRYGCVNVHASLLPLYRGAAPIQWAVVRGERESGVTTMYMAPELDTGDIIYREATPIGDTDTAGSLHDRLMVMGARLLVRTLTDIEAGTAPRIPQDNTLASFAPTLKREDARVDWTAPAVAVSAFIRGMSPFPGAYAGAAGETLKVFFAMPAGRYTDGEPGSVVQTGSAGIEVLCGDGRAVLLTEVQAKGGRRMPAGDYARGHSVGKRL